MTGFEYLYSDLTLFVFAYLRFCFLLLFRSNLMFTSDPGSTKTLWYNSYITGFFSFVKEPKLTLLTERPFKYLLRHFLSHLQVYILFLLYSSLDPQLWFQVICNYIIEYCQTQSNTWQKLETGECPVGLGVLLVEAHRSAAGAAPGVKHGEGPRHKIRKLLVKQHVTKS